jgi:hypothetical protein
MKGLNVTIYMHASNSIGLPRTAPVLFMVRSMCRRNCTTKPAHSTYTQAQKIHTTPIISKPSPNPFFAYTSGRWLENEEERLRERYRLFDPYQLQIVGAQTVGSRECISMVKAAEGHHNKVFRLIMDDNKVVMAKVSNPIAGPSFYTTASEVATMKFVREILEIPAPKVLGWSSTSKNPVGAKYILMEEAEGDNLTYSFEKFSSDKRLAIIRNLIEIEKKLLSVEFTR